MKQESVILKVSFTLNLIPFSAISFLCTYFNVTDFSLLSRDSKSLPLELFDDPSLVMDEKLLGLFDQSLKM